MRPHAAARAPAGQKVILMLDPDEAGRRSSEAITQGLNKLQIDSMDATERFNLQGNPNELLLKDRIDFSYFLSQMDEMMRKSGPTKPSIANRIAEIERTADYSSQPGREYAR